jgi:hypothetical protein
MLKRWIVVYKGFGGPERGYSVISRDGYRRGGCPEWREFKAQSDCLGTAEKMRDRLLAYCGTVNAPAWFAIEDRTASLA